MNASNAASIDPAEVALFGGLAEDWWNPEGSSRMLHAINPVRLGYIREQALAHFDRDVRSRAPFAGLTALDIGCGGGLLCEPLGRLGFAVTGLDAAPENVAVARSHAAKMGVAVSYRDGSAEALAAERGRFDLVTCLEVVEHVADIDSFLAAVASLLAPGGLLIFSTPNRTAASWAVLIAGAERLFRVIPEGAHDWNKFLTPDELTAALARHGLSVGDLRGLTYKLGRGFAITGDTSINYIGERLMILKGIHHSAFRCRDAEQTRAFYEDLLGLPLAAVVQEEHEPGNAKPHPFVHLFFKMGDGNYFAFFDAPSSVTEDSFTVPHGFDRHVAFEADSEAELAEWQTKLKAADVPCFGPIDHHFVKSIYFWDPNGIPLEITARVAEHDAIMAGEAATARAVIDAWTARKAAAAA